MLVDCALANLHLNPHHVYRAGLMQLRVQYSRFIPVYFVLMIVFIVCQCATHPVQISLKLFMFCCITFLVRINFKTLFVLRTWV